MAFSTTVTVIARVNLDQQLDLAVASALPVALRSKRYGILVTRHSPEKFTVAVSESVPFGETREFCEW